MLALLFAADALLLRPAAGDGIVSAAHQPVIRIRSERKVPEAVVLDTTQPTMRSLATTDAVAVNIAAPAIFVRDSFAQFVSPPTREDVKGNPKRRFESASEAEDRYGSL